MARVDASKQAIEQACDSRQEQSMQVVAVPHCFQQAIAGAAK